MKKILSLIISAALIVSGYSQTRNVLVGTNNAVVQPTNFWSADASNARTGLGLGSAATNPASAFQPYSLVLSNLASSNAVNLTNLRATNIVGTLAIDSGGTGATNAAGARTNIGLGATNNVTLNAVSIAGGSLSSYFDFGNSVQVLAATNNQDGLTIFFTGSERAYIGYDGVILHQSGGALAFGAGNTSGAAITRTNLGLGATWLINTNVTNFRSAIGLGWSALTNTNITNFRTDIGLGATNNSFSALSVGINITNDSTASNASSAFGNQITIDSTVENSIAVGFGHSMSNFGNQAGGSVLLGGIGTMTNWGAFLFNGVPQGGTSAVSRGNSTFAVNASNGIYLNGPIILEFEQGVGTGQGLLSLGAGGGVEKVATNVFTATPAFVGWSGFAYTAFDAGTARTNIGLPWTGLTNTNAATFQTALFGSNTNPVLVDTNGSVVSPTNFWQQAPIATTVAISAPSTNSTNTATNSRNLIIQSLSSNIVNTTNTLLLPTNTSTFNGDTAVVIHAGGSGSATAIRQAGQTSNLIVLTNFDHALRFLYFNNTWDFYHNLAYVEPVYFSGTNAAALAAASRTNLGLGETNSVTFSALTLSSDLTFGGGDNIVLSTTNGTKIGTATNQLLGFYNQTPITRPSSTGVTTNGFTQGSGNNVHPNSTFTGGIGTNEYTISDIVAHLKSLGLIAP
jgi:hypothetical protein